MLSDFFSRWLFASSSNIFARRKSIEIFALTKDASHFKQAENRIKRSTAISRAVNFSKRLPVGLSPRNFHVTHGKRRAAPRRAGPSRAASAAAGILHDNDGTRAPTGMIRQSIVRGIVGVQKRRAKSACDATAMLRFFGARRGAERSGATTGCALFPASVLCFPAVDPLHRQSTHVCTRTHPRLLLFTL